MQILNKLSKRHYEELGGLDHDLSDLSVRRAKQWLALQ